MSPTQQVAFWTWYKTGLDGKRRSLEEASEILGKPKSTLQSWHASQNWDELAKQKDFELQERLEEELFRQFIDDAKDVMKRQRVIIRRVYEAAMKALKSGDLNMSVGDILKMLEYEARTVGAVEATGEKTLSLSLILPLLTPETRSDLYRAVRSSRRGVNTAGAGRGILPSAN